MAGAQGKAEATRQRMLEILRVDRKKHAHNSSLTAQQLARKFDLHKDTATRYLGILWRRGLLLRAKTNDKCWGYRIRLDEEDPAKFKKKAFGDRIMHAYEGGTK